MGIERRQHKRYSVSGQAEFQAGSVNARGELLDVGSGGVLVRSDVLPSDRSNLLIHFSIAGYPGVFDAKGRVVRTHLGVLAVMFLEPPAVLPDLLAWLEKRESAGAPS